jgi:hypothetical protein
MSYYKKDHSKNFLILINLIENKYNNYLNYIITLLIISLKDLRFYIISKQAPIRDFRDNILYQ